MLTHYLGGTCGACVLKHGSSLAVIARGDTERQQCARKGRALLLRCSTAAAVRLKYGTTAAPPTAAVYAQPDAAAALQSSATSASPVGLSCGRSCSSRQDRELAAATTVSHCSARQHRVVRAARCTLAPPTTAPARKRMPMVRTKVFAAVQQEQDAANGSIERLVGAMEGGKMPPPVFGAAPAGNRVSGLCATQAQRLGGAQLTAARRLQKVSERYGSAHSEQHLMGAR